MFCLRSWIPILFFLLRTNASPVYLILFLSATYFLNRPCVYCSFLLLILVIALFDFQSAWFETPLPNDTSSTPLNGTSPFRDNIFETASVMASAVTNTAQALVKAAVDGLTEKAVVSTQAENAQVYEWTKGLVGKKEWRIPCLDVLVRF
ncbi:hypothetical protein EJ04DRAFT_512664 [Polyplosphaeria fusca]|uniref:Uncharacterized protein n=1 Tax=Polyplosphaeria fusca TaxID=682080 RepID=A0A9P4V3B8_9PLEO|nr:hypothetical protein EJ04DRAFT_512664 [Polyplosphaeria fusca]